MKLSIITITYNNIEGFIQTFDSVIAQNWTDFEWIVIDGGSEDGTREFIMKNQERFSFWCSESDGGIYDAQNKGARQAVGDYLCFMNAGDCFIDNDVLSKINKYFGKADILYGDTIFVGKEKEEQVIHPQTLTLSWLSRYAINHQSAFIRRVVFEQFCFDLKYKMLADRKLWIQCMLQDKTFEKLPFFTTRYDANGLSSRNKGQWQHEHQEICDELLPKSVQRSLDSAHYFESSIDMQKTHFILQKEGPMRKILHLLIHWIGLCRGIVIKCNQYAAIKK